MELRKLEGLGPGFGRCKINFEVADLIRKMYQEEDHTMKKLAYLFDLSYAQIQRIVRNDAWVREAEYDIT